LNDDGHLSQRQVRRLLAEGRIASYEKGELVVKLQEMDFGEDEALLAAENCGDVYAATKFLRQECELCANVMNVTEVRIVFRKFSVTEGQLSKQVFMPMGKINRRKLWRRRKFSA
jgi:hypothetical protein